MAAPLVFAHRGASAAQPENTLAAYERAFADGADGVECDVRLTRDGHLVCVHDRRVDRTSDGRGRVSQLTLAELRALDFGSWHGAGRPATVVVLDELIDVAAAAGRPVELLVETKHPSRYGAAVERALHATLRRHGLDRPGGRPVGVTAMSFAPSAVRRVRQLLPGVPTVQLLDLLPPGLRTGRVPFGAPIAGPSVALLRSRPGLAAALRAAGKRLYLWTVNTDAEVDLALRHGVDGIITDRPDAVRHRLR
ncbi:glycerophosphoryl diester phosphodiesterase [Pilimelia terevasa]|uniref:Glycerophosphoryl diester phosphodiesterase n=1 Tax=Pilimelia terevasa TaxID=53372 RepID=A0A8J3BT93_9ACTN|nr:glycerophosphodiester phosphodiesterase family protein [Pilimelia terevasa]GGK32871.1 glycerophosphoryl diester phosphodiesterase [Pilimelia terevasa]